jgi:hypothetical protein
MVCGEVIKNKLYAFVNRCLRYILNILRPKKITTTDLWQVTGRAGFNLEVRRIQFRLLGHTLRNGYDGTHRTALTWNPQGKRKRGKSKTSWRRSVEKEYDKYWNVMRRDAQNRIYWHSILNDQFLKKDIIIIIIMIIIIIITAPLLKYIFDLSLSEEHFPMRCKNAITVPIFKKGNSFLLAIIDLLLF